MKDNKSNIVAIRLTNEELEKLNIELKAINEFNKDKKIKMSEMIRSRILNA